MKTIYALVDYKGHFGSKYNARPFRSGMDKDFLGKEFNKHGILIDFINVSQVFVNGAEFWKGKYVIYTSSEDIGYYYKSFIEDVVYALEMCGAKVIPAYKFLRATNNKVFMELLKKTYKKLSNDGLDANVYGCFEEFKMYNDKTTDKIVYKSAEGAKSKGVGLYSNSSDDDLIKKISTTKNLRKDLWDFGRSLKHKGYLLESRFRKKFITQKFVKGLDADWKVLVFGSKYYLLNRKVRDNDFRASGSGKLSYLKDIPNGILEFSSMIFDELNVPFAGFDIAFDGVNYYLIEFQCLFFGTYTLTYSEFYWKREGNNFKLIESKSLLEEEYVEAVSQFLMIQGI